MNSKHPFSSKQTHPRIRRTADQWRAILKQFQQSGLSAPKFCEQYDIGYGSFCKWRQRFNLESDTRMQSSEPSSPTFIDLGVLESRSDSSQAASSPSWHIVLKLGNGVELCLSQTSGADHVSS